MRSEPPEEPYAPENGNFGCLDEEFVSSWRRWVPLHPAPFFQALTHGTSGARAEVSLYPDGGAGVDLRIHADGALLALMLLRLSFGDRTMFIDEIRLTELAQDTGLFQRLMFNSAALGRAIGFSEIRFRATGDGGYSFAAFGFPRDVGLRRRTLDSDD